MKTIYNNQTRKFFIAGLALVIVASLGFFIQSCSHEDDLYNASDIILDQEIVNSQELEELILAGVEYNNALKNLTKEFSKIDFSTLEVTYNVDGRKVAHLPSELIESIRFDEKERFFYEKKEAFRKKFPHFLLLNEKTAKNYFQHCIQNSVKISSEFAKLGIKTTQQRLKNSNEINWDENFNYIFYCMYNWVQEPDDVYLERYIIGYADGSFDTLILPGASNTNGGQFIYETVGGHTVYYPKGARGDSHKVVSVGHTHKYNANPTKNTYYDDGTYKDGDYFPVPSSVTRYIYYNNELIYY